jgi:phosphohistidine phosphatase SixA
MLRIMIIRHAEKHTDGGHEHGVTLQGEPAKHELTVRGWQRAGALAAYFTLAGGPPESAPISTPRSIFASASIPESPSLRALHTAEPLAAALDLPINANHPEGDEAAVAAAAIKAPGPVLIVWHHSHIPALVRQIGGAHIGCPKDWPDERFDVVWVLDRADAPDAPWRFSQVAQRIFAQDRAEAF